MLSVPRGLAPLEGLERWLMKMGRIGPLVEPHSRPQADKSGDPVPRTPTISSRPISPAHVAQLGRPRPPQSRTPSGGCCYLSMSIKTLVANFFTANSLKANIVCGVSKPMKGHKLNVDVAFDFLRWVVGAINKCED